jgi:6-phosphofructokinase
LLLLAQVEASSARKGIGLVKLMGRQSGFIAVQASMASGVQMHCYCCCAAAAATCSSALLGACA